MYQVAGPRQINKQINNNINNSNNYNNYNNDDNHFSIADLIAELKWRRSVALVTVEGFGAALNSA